MQRPFEALLRRLNALEAIHDLYQQAEDELLAHIGVPICVPGCGKCCTRNTPMVWGIEVEAIATYLLGQGQLLDDVLDRCQEWLLNGTGSISSVRQLIANRQKLLQRTHEVMTEQCPLLNNQLRCLIHPERPLTCRAFGVTRYPTDCPRPLGLGETPNLKAYNQGMGEVIEKAMNKLLVASAKEDEFSATVGFLPTLLMSRLRSEVFVNMVDSGKVDPVKLVRNFVHSPSILTQHQIIDFSLAGDEALQEVERKGIKTGPITVTAN